MSWNRRSSHQAPTIRATVDKRQLVRGCMLLLGAALLLVVALMPQHANAPGADEEALVAADAANRLSSDCQLIQHVSFTPCGHSMTRRQQLPVELSGRTRDELSDAYSQWIITAFSPTQVTMERSIGLYCPEHVVLMPDESGQLCIFRNTYGDALALVKELHLPLRDLPDETQELLRPGKGFDDEEALEKWLESIQS